MACPLSSPINNPTELSSHNKESYKSNNEGYLWLGSRGSKGTFVISVCLQKCMLKYFFFLWVHSVKNACNIWKVDMFIVFESVSA